MFSVLFLPIYIVTGRMQQYFVEGAFGGGERVKKVEPIRDWNTIIRLQEAMRE